MADTIFVLGALSVPRGRAINGWWETKWYYTRRAPQPVVEWLESNVDHSVGWDILPGRGEPYGVISFITVHDPNAALELRMRWNAKHTTFAQIRDLWNDHLRITLAFEKLD